MVLNGKNVPFWRRYHFHAVWMAELSVDALDGCERFGMSKKRGI